MADDGLMDVRHGLEQSTPTWHLSDVADCIRRKENRLPIKHPYFHAVYEPLRRVSLSILRDEGAGLYQQDQEAEGVIFDGSWLWEKYLWTLLEPLGFEHADNKKKANGWKPLEGIEFYPDFFHQKNRTILDAKYQRSERSRQDAARQVFGYMFILDAIYGGLIKPDEGGGTRENIKRQGENAQKAVWHDLALTPSDKATTRDFCREMCEKEEAFKKDLVNRFGCNQTVC